MVGAEVPELAAQAIAIVCATPLRRSSATGSGASGSERCAPSWPGCWSLLALAPAAAAAAGRRPSCTPVIGGLPARPIAELAPTACWRSRGAHVPRFAELRAAARPSGSTPAATTEWQVAFLRGDDEVAQVLLDDCRERARGVDRRPGRLVHGARLRGRLRSPGDRRCRVWLVLPRAVPGALRPAAVADAAPRPARARLAVGLLRVLQRRAGSTGRSRSPTRRCSTCSRGCCTSPGARRRAAAAAALVGHRSGSGPAIVFLVAFRLGLQYVSSNVIDVGYAGVIGADRLAHLDDLYGSFPPDNPRGDTYGPLLYLAYVPFELVWPWSGTWDDLPGRARRQRDLRPRLRARALPRRPPSLATARPAARLPVAGVPVHADDRQLGRQRCAHRRARARRGGAARRRRRARDGRGADEVRARRPAAAARPLARGSWSARWRCSRPAAPWWPATCRTSGTARSRFQAERDSPFSVWGLYDLPRPARRAGRGARPGGGGRRAAGVSASPSRPHCSSRSSSPPATGSTSTSAGSCRSRSWRC